MRNLFFINAFRDLGNEVETWDAKFANLLGYLEDNVNIEHGKIMVNHFQFAKNAEIAQSQAKNTTEELRQWRDTMASNGKVINQMKMAFHFIGGEAEDSFDQLEESLKGQTNSQSIAFNVSI